MFWWLCCNQLRTYCKNFVHIRVMCAILLWNAFMIVWKMRIYWILPLLYLNYLSVGRQKKHRPTVRREHSMARAMESWSGNITLSDIRSANKCWSRKQCRLTKKTSVGKALRIVSNRRSANLCRSGKTFADRTYSDRHCRSAKLIPDRLSVGVSGFSDQLVCWGSSAVV
jgi:hypothetical protein